MSLETEVQWDENERFAFCTCLKKKKKRKEKIDLGIINQRRYSTVLFSMSGKRRGNGPFKMTLAQQARTMSYYNPAIKKENFLTADRKRVLSFTNYKKRVEQVQTLLKEHSFYYHKKIYCARQRRKLSTGLFSSI